MDGQLFPRRDRPGGFEPSSFRRGRESLLIEKRSRKQTDRSFKTRSFDEVELLYRQFLFDDSFIDVSLPCFSENARRELCHSRFGERVASRRTGGDDPLYRFFLSSLPPFRAG